MTKYQNYTVQQGDTLESIAAAKLNSADRWRDIAIINQLRQPFISDDPYQQYGPASTRSAGSIFDLHHRPL